MKQQLLENLKKDTSGKWVSIEDDSRGDAQVAGERHTLFAGNPALSGLWSAQAGGGSINNTAADLAGRKIRS